MTVDELVHSVCEAFAAINFDDMDHEDIKQGLVATGIPLSVLAALADGTWQAVPKDLTEGMQTAGEDELFNVSGFAVGHENIYQAILAAAPAEPEHDDD